MQYLKLYENFYDINNREAIINKEVISIDKKLVSIDDKTISAVNKLGFSSIVHKVDNGITCSENGIEIIKITIPVNSVMVNNKSIGPIGHKKISTKNKNIYIWQYEDEWYEVEFYNIDNTYSSYWCDQIEGLIKCLKEIETK